MVDRLQRLTAKLSNDREPIGRAIEALDSGTASIADLLAHARAPLADTVDQLSRLAPLLQQDQGHIDGQLQLLPEDYRKMSRLGAYGSFLPRLSVWIVLPAHRFTRSHRAVPVVQRGDRKVRGTADA